MKRWMLPWLLPVVMLLALLVAVTNSTVVYVAVSIVGLWVVLPLALSLARKSGLWPRSLGGGSDRDRPRFPGM